MRKVKPCPALRQVEMIRAPKCATAEFLCAMWSRHSLATYIASLAPEGKVADVLGSTAPSVFPHRWRRAISSGGPRQHSGKQPEMPQHTLTITSYNERRPSFARGASLTIACLAACSHMTAMGRCDFVAFLRFLG